jgi:uncharacterized protein YacL
MLLQYLYEYINGEYMFAYTPPWVPVFTFLACAVASGLIFTYLSRRIANLIANGVKGLEDNLAKTPSTTLLAGSIGLVIGLVVAALISIIIGLIPVAWLSVPLTIVDYLLFGYLGVATGVKRRGDLANYFAARKADGGNKTDAVITPKILDSSVIIDGRIFDICKTGMFEGDILVPGFVVDELQKIADSSDPLKRSRGRRGLDIVSRMRKELNVPVSVVEARYDDTPEVDAKLVKMAKDYEGKIVTNDYNLNKAAGLHGVPVFNINELANAVKPVLVAGEELVVAIVKDGKEENQGVAYLDDGTMIVVEGARGMEGSTIRVTVTSILQTAAGRMIFARIV